MPPLPSSKKPAASRGSRRATAGGGSSEGPTSSPPPAPSRGRVTKADSLRLDVARLYMMTGTMIRPFGRFYPVLTPVGDNLKQFSDEAAEAWMQLAEKDSRVKDILISLTSASVWGNVIGIHFAIFATALPGASAYAAAMGTPTQESTDPLNDIMSQMSPEDIALAEQLAGRMMGADNIPARDKSTGGPGDTVAAPPAPEFSPPREPVPTAAPAASQASIPSPSELGVSIIDPAQGNGAFPADAGAAHS